MAPGRQLETHPKMRLLALGLLVCVAVVCCDRGRVGGGRRAELASELSSNRRPALSRSETRHLDKHSQPSGPFKSNRGREKRHRYESPGFGRERELRGYSDPAPDNRPDKRQPRQQSPGIDRKRSSQSIGPLDQTGSDQRPSSNNRVRKQWASDSPCRQGHNQGPGQLSSDHSDHNCEAEVNRSRRNRFGKSDSSQPSYKQILDYYDPDNNIYDSDIDKGRTWKSSGKYRKARAPNAQFPGSSSRGSSNSQESEYNHRPNQQSSSSFGHGSSNSQESEYSHRPNQQSSSSFGHGSSNSQESEYSHRPNQQSYGSFGHGSSNSQGSEYNHRPNQQSSSSFGHGSSNSQGSEYSHRPNQQSSSSFGHGSSNSQESEYNHRPNQQSSSSFGHGSSNSQESEYSHRPNQQSSGSFGHGSSNNKRPNQQHSSGHSGTSQTQNQHSTESSGSSGLTGSNQNSGNQHGSNQWHSSGNTGSNNQSSNTSGSNKKPQGSDEKEICYNLFGCFSVTEPWYSKLRPVPGPLGPDKNRAEVYFYSRPHTDQRYIINLYPEYSLGDAKFDPRKPTVIIVHGFIQGGDANWMGKMKDAYLKHVDANAMIVDWRTGAQRLSYLQAAGNTRLIGRMVGYLVKSLVSSHGAKPGTFHLIGHSLGAQIASYIAKEVPGIGRLTALDPAQPGFEGLPKSVRLDVSDAKFVDVVHTNAKPFIPFFGLGMMKPHGHVDFYINGGFDQPLCVAPAENDLKPIKSILDLGNLPLEWFTQTLLCDHARAYSYFIEAVESKDCIFWGHNATVKKVAQTVANLVTQGLLSKYVALSGNCTVDTCVPLGLGTELSHLRGSFVVTTNGKSPYCRDDTDVEPTDKPQDEKKEKEEKEKKEKEKKEKEKKESGKRNNTRH